MKNKLRDYTDKQLLRKRALSDSVNEFLKNVCQIKNLRYRSVTALLINVVSAPVDYSFMPSKYSLHLVPLDMALVG